MKRNQPQGCAFAGKLNRYIDCELSAIETSEIEKHIETCEECRQTISDYLIIRNKMVSMNNLSAGLQAGIEKKIFDRAAAANAKINTSDFFAIDAFCRRLVPVAAAICIALICLFFVVESSTPIKTAATSTTSTTAAATQTKQNENIPLLASFLTDAEKKIVGKNQSVALSGFYESKISLASSSKGAVTND